MKTILRNLLLLCLLSMSLSVGAQQRRPIDSRHPLWLIHVDVWNKANPQAIIDMIPKDIRPFVCMNLSLSCSYDTEKNVYKMPQNGVATYKSWATVCQQNGMWFTCQPASGGHTHIQDDDLETFEYFFKHYPNFLGWNYAEQFWGFDEKGDKSSSTQESRIALFAKLVEMSHKYGGFLTISFCGNIWSHALSPLGMLKRNADLLAACEKYPEAILWLYKYTTTSCFYNTESVTWGPYIAGLANNYGVRYDNCGWNGALSVLLGDDNGKKYPVAAGLSTVMEQSCVNGGAVWDGPELIWTEDIKNLDNTKVNGYTHRNWGFFPGFQNVWVDMFRKIIDGSLYIPTRQEVLGKTKIVVVNDINTGNIENQYGGWNDLYDGLYKQEDPMNKGNGYFMDNLTWFKKTGRYGAIPIVPELHDNLAKAIPLQIKKSAKWSSQREKLKDFNAQYPVVSTGDLYVNRYRNQLITYTPYSYFNKKRTATATIPLQYNTCKELQLTWGMLTAAAVREYADHINFYLNNYRVDTIAPVTDKVVVKGATAKPSYTYTVGTETIPATVAGNQPQAELSDTWDAATGTYTLLVSHCGSVNIKLSCQGNATGRSTDYLPDTSLESPKQPEAYTGPVTIEAEDIDYRSIQECCLSPYNVHPDERGNAGNGYIIMGTSKNGSLRHVFNANVGGNYRVTLRYMNTDKKGNLKLNVNGTEKKVGCAITGNNNWSTVSLGFQFNKGANTLTIDNISGTNLCLDQVVYEPTTEQVKDDVAFEDEPDEPITPSDPAYPYVVLKDNFAQEGGGKVPQGWVMADGDKIVSPGTYGSGPRIFQFPEGSTFTYGLYVRTPSSNDGYGIYGTMPDYQVSLKSSAKYCLGLDAVAWKDTPYLKVEVLDENNTVIKSTIVPCKPNLEGSTTNVFTGATHVSLGFTVPKDGNYLFRFSPVLNEDGDGGYWREVMIGNIVLTSDTPSTGIRNLLLNTKNAGKTYDLSGRQVSGKATGVIIKNGHKYISK